MIVTVVTQSPVMPGFLFALSENFSGIFLDNPELWAILEYQGQAITQEVLSC
jgi:hypothetical protein